MNLVKNSFFNSELGLMRFFALFSALMFPLFGVIHRINGDESDSLFLRFLLSALCITGVLLTFFVKYFKENYIYPVYGMSFVCILWFSYTMYLEGYSNNYVLGSFILISAPALLMKTVRVLLFFLAYCVIIIAGTAFLHPSPEFSPWILAPSMFSFSLMIFLFRRSSIRLQDKLKAQALLLKNRNVRIEEQHQKLTEVNEIIKDKNQSITDSIEYAETIQKAMLPREEFFEKNFNSYFLWYQPRDIVSGDFFWSHETEDKLIWATADCTGHGVPGAFMSLISMSLLQEISLRAKENLSASTILNQLRSRITEHLNQGGNSNKHDGLDISLCVMEKQSLKLFYSGAYNDLLVYRNGEQFILKGNQQPVGLYHHQIPFTDEIIQLEKTDLVISFSDGLTDQLGGKSRRKYSIRRLLQLIDETDHSDLEKLKAQIMEQHYLWRGKESQLDDIVILGVRI